MFFNPVRRLLVRYARSGQASLSVVFAIALPALAVAAAGATELVEVMRTKSMLQTAADSAALNGAAQFGTDRSQSTTERVLAVADELVRPARTHWSVQTKVAADPQSGSITVFVDAQRPSFFHDLLPPGGFQVHVQATATNSAKYPLCVLGMLTNSPATETLTGSAVLSAAKCLVQSNGDISVGGNAAIKASAVRSAGRATGNISPAPSTDSPVLNDPFAGIPISVPTICTDTSIQVGNGTTTLNPGVHCGTIAITGNGTLVLNPGEHYFVGPTVALGGNMTLTGSDVVIILGAQTALSLKGSASITIEGRKTGPYAGFALMTDRSFSGTLTISAKNAKKLLGTIYIPNGSLAVDGNGNKVADQSAWTIIVAKTISVAQSANLVINSDYSASSVPVPSGVGPGVLKLTN